MAEDERARLLARSLLNLAGDRAGDATEPRHLTGERRPDPRCDAARGDSSLGGHDDREVPAGAVTRADFLTHALDVEWNLGDEDDIGAPRQPAVERDEAGAPPHHLHHDHAVMTLRGRVQLVDGFEDRKGVVEG